MNEIERASAAAGKVEIGLPREPAERKWEVESPLSKLEVVAMRSEEATG
jgi:hypothetical protein